jgi:ribose-phosphate pyrophosphokinase
VIPVRQPVVGRDASGGNVLFNTVLFTGNANPRLAQEIASHLGIELGKAKVGRFSDGEVDIEIQQNVRARDIFVVQPTCAPTNENLMELCIMVDALKRASARRVTAVIPTSATPARTAARAPRACRSAPRSSPTCWKPWASSGC